MTEIPTIAPYNRMSIYVQAFAGLLARDTRVLRRDFIPFLLRTVMNPFMFTFIFAYVFPKIGEGFGSGGVSAGFGTILVPGLVAVSMIFQGIAAVALPLVNEFGRTKEIEDRLMAPLPVAGVAGEDHIRRAAKPRGSPGCVPHRHGDPCHAGFYQRVELAPAHHRTPACQPDLRGIRPRDRDTLIFSIIVVPMTFLGCVYYPWQLLKPLPGLCYAVLVNPVVYISEGLRAALTSNVPHMSVPVFLDAMVLMLTLLSTAAFRLFLRRVTT